MLSALISSKLSYPAMPRAGQLADQRFVHPDPLVQWTSPLKYQTPAADRDQPVLRISSLITKCMDYITILHLQDNRRLVSTGSICISSSLLMKRFFSYTRLPSVLS